MKALLTFLILAVAVLANAQDLLNDFNRGVYTYGESASYSGGSDAFSVGFVQFDEQVLISETLENLTNAEGTSLNANVYGTQGPVSSAIWFNLGSSAYTLPNSKVLPSQSVTLQAIDEAPVVEAYETVGGSINVHTHATTVAGTSTPGTLICLSYIAGTWTTVFSHTMTTATFDDDRTITLPMTRDITHLRWLLARTGAAAAEITLEVHIK